MTALNPLAPFVDDELVAQRVQQRKVLADIPDWVIDGLLYGMATTDLPLSDVAGRAERRLRELATAEMVGAHSVHTLWRRDGAAPTVAGRPGVAAREVRA